MQWRIFDFRVTNKYPSASTVLCFCWAKSRSMAVSVQLHNLFEEWIYVSFSINKIQPCVSHAPYRSQSLILFQQSITYSLTRQKKTSGAYTESRSKSCFPEVFLNSKYPLICRQSSVINCRRHQSAFADGSLLLTSAWNRIKSDENVGTSSALPSRNRTLWHEKQNWCGAVGTM